MDKMQQTRWGSHIPINKTLHELFDVTGVMELGMGFFSTPIFTSLSPYTISIESDIQWIDNLEEQGIGNTTTHKIVHHNINNDNIDRSTDYTDISDSVKETANILYDQYLTDNINYLFIDCYGGLRLSALQSLYDKMDIIVFHDAGISDSHQYGYEHFIEHPNYLMFHDCSYSPWTGFLIKKSLMDDETFNQIVEVHSKHFIDHVSGVPGTYNPKIKRG